MGAYKKISKKDVILHKKVLNVNVEHKKKMWSWGQVSKVRRVMKGRKKKGRKDEEHYPNSVLQDVTLKKTCVMCPML